MVSTLVKQNKGERERERRGKEEEGRGIFKFCFFLNICNCFVNNDNNLFFSCYPFDMR